MEVIDPGHEYLLQSFDGGEPIKLTFVKRDGAKYPGNVGAHPGTQMQEVLRALIERSEYVYKQTPCDETMQAVSHFKSALYLFEKRHARLHDSSLRVNLPIEQMPFCSNCGHIQCFCEEN